MARRGAGGSAALVPLGVGAAGIGVATAISPIVGLGLATLAILSVLPWAVLWTLLCFLSFYSRGHGISVAGLNLQPAAIILVPLSIRVFFLTRRDVRPRWRWPEWFLITFIALQFVTSFLNAKNVQESFLAAGQLTIGVVAYLTTFTGLCTRRRLILGAKIALIAGLSSAVVGIATVVAHYGLGINFLLGTAGSSHQGTASAAAKAFTFEHDIFGSFAAATAVAFFVLMRERNPLFSRRFCMIAFWIASFANLVSLTRASWIGEALALCVVFLFPQRYVRRRRMVAQTGLIAAGLGALLIGVLFLKAQPPTAPIDSGLSSATGSVQNVGNQLFNLSSGSGEGRVAEAKVALTDLKGSPLIGLGTNSYGQRHIAPKSNPKNPQPGFLGNQYLRTLYDSGIVGFLLLVCALIRIIWPRRVYQISRGDLASVARAFIFSYLVIAICNTATDASLQIWPWICLGLARAAGAMAERQYRTARAEPPVAPGTDRAVVPASGSTLRPGARGR